MRRIIIMLNLKDKNKEILKLLLSEVLNVFNVSQNYRGIPIYSLLVKEIDNLPAEEAFRAIVRIKQVINKYG